MRRIFRPFVILLSALALTTSCLSDDDQTDIIYYNDTAVTSFSLGTLNRTMWTTSSEGEDSSYVEELDGSEYDFYIDQLAKRIYNADSLPKGTDAAHVLCNAGAKNGGLLIWAFKNSEGEDSLVYFNSNDSVDFTEPRELRVYSNSGLEYRTYKVEVNVHREVPDSINWQPMGTYAPLTALEAMKAVVTGGNRLFVLGKSGGETVVYAKDGNGQWAEKARLDGGEVYSGVVTRGDSLYAVMTDGSVARSYDGTTWTAETAEGGVKPVRLTAAGSGRLYGVTADGRMASSAHAGYGWSVDGQPADMSELPATEVGSAVFALTTNSDAERIVMVGNRDRAAYPEDTVAVVWNKIEEYAADSEAHSWMPCNENNKMRLPNMASLSVAGYGDVLLAIGGKGAGQSAPEAYSCIYVSRDNGLTWQADGSYYLPGDFDNGQSSVAAMATDDDGFIWIMCGGTGQVWRGRLNRMGWTDEQTSFLK